MQPNLFTTTRGIYTPSSWVMTYSGDDYGCDFCGANTALNFYEDSQRCNGILIDPEKKECKPQSHGIKG